MLQSALMGQFGMDSLAVREDDMSLGHFVGPAAEQLKTKAEKLKALDDWAGRLIHGAPGCSEPGTYELLLLLYHLCLKFPHVSKNPAILESEIRKEAKKL